MSIKVIKALRLSNIKIDMIKLDNRISRNKCTISYPEPLIFQTPYLKVNGGLRATAIENCYLIETLFIDENDQAASEWYNFIENLENHVTDSVVAQGSDWFDESDVGIKSLIRQYENSGVIYIKWPLDLHPELFVDEDYLQYDPQKLRDGDYVKLIVEITGVWITHNMFGLAVIARKVRVKSNTNNNDSYNYVYDSDSESEVDQSERNIISLLATEQKPKTTSNHKPVTMITSKPVATVTPTRNTNNQNKIAANTGKYASIDKNQSKLNKNQSDDEIDIGGDFSSDDDQSLNNHFGRMLSNTMDDFDLDINDDF